MRRKKNLRSKRENERRENEERSEKEGGKDRSFIGHTAPNPSNLENASSVLGVISNVSRVFHF